MVITRFAPSPTGFLHMGSARTALFNWLYARKLGGIFRLRIEDTDVSRSTKEAVDAIFDSMKWLGLDYDAEAVMQSKNMARHAEVAHHMVELGVAYKCYVKQEELENFRLYNPNKKFVSPWRDKFASTPQSSYVIRIRSKDTGLITFNDTVFGEISTDNADLDDMVLLRANGMATYMLACVVDDYDMKVTHIIRGDDHMTNTARQLQIYEALDWHRPTYAHIPLIHSKEGGKLSKRHGALGVHEYKQMGYLPEAVLNYLLRLGWGHKDVELITMDKALELFDLSDIQRSPAKFDIEKLDYMNNFYIKASLDERIMSLLDNSIVNSHHSKSILRLMPLLKERARTLRCMEDDIRRIFYQSELDEKSEKILKELTGSCITELFAALSSINDNSFNYDKIKLAISKYVEQSGLKMGQVMQVLRACIIGSFNSPGIIEVMEALGKVEVLNRINQQKA